MILNLKAPVKDGILELYLRWWMDVRFYFVYLYWADYIDSLQIEVRNIF